MENPLTLKEVETLIENAETVTKEVMETPQVPESVGCLMNILKESAESMGANVQFFDSSKGVKAEVMFLILDHDPY